MKNTLLFFLLFFSISLSAQLDQFRMIGSASWTVDSPTNYSATVTFQSDLTGNGFLPTGITDTMQVFTQTGQLYTIFSAANLTFSTADLVIVESGGDWGAPVGQVMVYEDEGRTAVPAIPFGSTGSVSKMMEAVDSYNSRIIGSGGGSMTDPQVETAYNNQVPQASLIEAQEGTLQVDRRFTPELAAAYANAYASPKLTTHIIASNSITGEFSIRVDTMTDYQRGVALQTVLDQVTPYSVVLVPPFQYKAPAGQPIEMKSPRTSLMGYNERNTAIYGDSSHAFVMGNQNLYRCVVSGFEFMTVRNELDGAQYDAIHLSDVTYADVSGAFQFRDCHVSESDRDGIHIGKNRTFCVFKDMAMTGGFDIQRYGIMIDSNVTRCVIEDFSYDSNVFLDEGSFLNSIFYYGAEDKGEYNIIDNGVDNVVVTGGDIFRTTFNPMLHPDEVDYYSPFSSIVLDSIYDYSPNNITASLEGTKNITSEYKDGWESLKFTNNDNSGVSIPYTSALDFTQNNQFYIGMMININGNDDDSFFMSKNGAFQIQYRHSDNNIVDQLFYDGVFNTRTYEIDTSKWVHYAVAYDGNIRYAFLDGVQVDADTINKTLPANSNFISIGSFYNFNLSLGCNISDIVISNRFSRDNAYAIYRDITGRRPPFSHNISGEQVATTTTTTSMGTYPEDVSFYSTLNEVEVDTIRDRTVNRLDGLIGGTVKPAIVRDTFGGLLFENNENHYLRIYHSADKLKFDSTDQYLISAMVKITGNTDNGYIMTKQGQLQCQFNNSNLTFSDQLYWDGSFKNLSYSVDTAVWFHWITAFDGDRRYAYVNGEEVATALATTALDINTADFIFGNFYNLAASFGCQISDLVISDKFNVDQVEGLYRSAIAREPLLKQPSIRAGSGITIVGNTIESNGTDISTINNIGNVDAASPSDGQVLQYQSITSTWDNVALSSSSIPDSDAGGYFNGTDIGAQLQETGDRFTSKAFLAVSGGSTSFISGTPERIDGDTPGTTTDVSSSSDWTIASSRCTYTGATTQMFKANAFFSGSLSSAGNPTYYIAKNGTLIGSGKARDHGNTDIGNVSLQWVVSLATNDYIEIYVDGPADETVNVSSYNISIERW